MARVLYISYDGISEPLGQSQIISYLKKLSHENDIHLITYEKKSLNFDDIIDYLKLNNIKVLDISTEDGDLEDVFVQLTKNIKIHVESW